MMWGHTSGLDIEVYADTYQAARDHMNQPRIYVACLAAYSNGILHGSWLDLNSDVSTLRDEITHMLAQSPEPNAEEYAIHDSENLPEYLAKEFTSLELLAEYAQLLEELPSNQKAAIDAYIDCFYSVPSSSEFSEAYQGEYSSLEDYAAQLLHSTGFFHGIPETIQNYFDFQAYARDMEYNSDVVYLNHRFVFLNH